MAMEMSQLRQPGRANRPPTYDPLVTHIGRAAGELPSHWFTSSSISTARVFEAAGDEKGRARVIQVSELTSWLAGSDMPQRGPPEASSVTHSIRIMQAMRITQKHSTDGVTNTLPYSHFPTHGNAYQFNTSRETLTSILDSFKLHETTAEAILNINGSFASYWSSRDSVQDKSPRSLSIVVHVPNKSGTGRDALSLTYNCSSRSTCALLHGSFESDWKDLVTLLQNVEPRDLVFHPFFLPTALFLIQGRNCERARLRLNDLIFDTEHETGYGVALQLLPTDLHSFGAGRPVVDVDALSRRLHSCQTDASTLACVLRYGVRYGDFLARGVREVGKALVPGELAGCEKALLDMLELPRAHAETTLSQMQSERERIQAQMTLIFGLISQDENRLSRLVAEESAKIAIATKKDSSAMRTIAIVTMLFLPATTVAAILSMPFFDWAADSSSAPTASRYIWVYLAVVVPLTVLLLACGYVWRKSEERRESEHVGKA